jgi:predicted transcriptional regulator of viral defense system
MKTKTLNYLSNKLFFSVDDLAEATGIKNESAQVLCSRYVKNGFFLRLKKNFYVLAGNWPRYNRDDYFKIANYLQVPSYVSCVTALSFYGITTQVQRDWYDNISVKRSIRFDAEGVAFNYYKLKREYYFGFIKHEDLFIATKEKAFVDTAHLCAFGKYSMDWHACGLETLDKKLLAGIAAIFPEKTQRIIRGLCRI